MIPNKLHEEHERALVESKYHAWCDDHYTKIFLEKLRQWREGLLEKAEMKSGLAIPSIEYQSLLIQAKTIREIINHVQNHKIPS